MKKKPHLPVGELNPGLQAPVLEMFAANHSYFYYLASSSRGRTFLVQWLFSLNHLKVLFSWLLLIQNSFCHYLELSLAWKRPQFSHFFDFSKFHWPFCQFGRIVNKEQNWDSRACFSELERAEKLYFRPRQARNRPARAEYWNNRFVSELSFEFVDNLPKRTSQEQIGLKFSKIAKKSYFLELTPVWQRLAGNLTILPRSSR